MNVLSLFDGMSCGRIALDRIGIDYDKYYACEVDRSALVVSSMNYPDTIRLGDVRSWREWDIDWSSIGLLIGGSPCQGFSYSGKGLAFNDPRSILFFEYVDILNHIRSVNPGVLFLLENVNMKSEFMDIITSYLGASPVFINSSLLSAQSRQRQYWCNWGISVPEDLGIELSQVMESGLDGCGLGGRIVGRRLRADGKRSDYDKTIPLHQYLEVRFDGKQNCLTTVYKDSVIPFEPYEGRTRIEFNGGRGKKGGFSVDRGYCRMMTPLECERLQTVPEGYTEGISQSQRYRILGNGWTVDVISHILRQIRE
jgi:site-specific DNA-cytosine methylase